jgi:hypothetical protein
MRKITCQGMQRSNSEDEVKGSIRRLKLLLPDQAS